MRCSSYWTITHFFDLILQWIWAHRSYKLTEPALERCGEGLIHGGKLRKRREYYADNYMELMRTE